MITGPVTEKENNKDGIWGSWVYQGELITVEIKTPIVSMKEFILHSSNVAYGYKEIYKSIKVGGFGSSGPCNINVICPLGNGWEGERNSVSTILSANGGEFCTGSLIMNTCGTNTPYYLTANHCFEQGNSNVPGWRFAFQAWSTTCPNPGVNTNGVMYNGATLRARNAASDFCLVELNQTPPANSGLHYAGWNRSATPAQNATGIHHPSGDLMKISRANNPVTVASAFGTTNQHWRANWSPQNNGAGQIVTPITETGSSGSPFFDQNHRVIGQLHGGPSACGAANLWDFYGRFDLSWIGGGTNTTRLSNWLDPNNTGAITTNTTNVSSLIATLPSVGYIYITGTNDICDQSIYTLVGAPPGATISWALSNPNIATLISNGNQVTVTPLIFGQPVSLEATVSQSCNLPKVESFLIRPFANILTVPQNLVVCYDDYYNLEYPQPIDVLYCPSNGIVTWDVPSEFNGDYTIVGNRLTLNSGPSYPISQYSPLWISASVYNPSTGLTYTTHTNFWTQSCYGYNDKQISKQVTLSPNPTTGQFNITLSTEDKATFVKEVRIKNKMGVYVLKQKFSNNQKSQIINLFNQPTDIYIIEIFDGKNWLSQKLSLTQ